MATKREASIQGLDTDLEDLRALKRRAEGLASSQLEALDVFNLARDAAPLVNLRKTATGVGGFANFVPDADERRDGTGRESLASTARCVRSLGVCRDVKLGYADFGPALDGIVRRYEGHDLATYGLDHLNAFTLGQLLPVVRDVAGSSPPDPLQALVADGLDHLRDEVAHEGVSVPARPESERRFPPHGYLTYWALVALASWDRLEPHDARPSLRWSETELYRQIGLFTAGNDERSDAYQLGYNLLVQHRFNRFGLGDSLVDLGLGTMFGAQLERGVWEKRAPLFRYGDLGGAYCFSFELLSSLLRQFRDEWEFLVPYEAHLATALGWAERNAMLDFGPPLWRSGQAVEEPSPESWATAEVYSFLQQYASYLSWRIESIVLRQFEGRPARPPDSQAFDGLYQPDVALPGVAEPIPLATLLQERLLEPLRAPGEQARYSLVHHPDRDDRVLSGILFGPPGTGKSTYVRRVARYLGWPLVTLDPSDFAGGGLHLIATVATEVFSKLFELEDTVIFFDEMETLMRTRSEGGGSFEENFLTTSFIPRLQELADRAASLFFVATNHYASIDPAAKRPGRFDFRLQILPPSYDEKLRMARDMLGDEDYAVVEQELRAEPYRRHLALASRSEMTRLLHDLKERPKEAEQLLDGFQAELADDARIDEERRYNSFDRRS